MSTDTQINPMLYGFLDSNERMFLEMLFMLYGQYAVAIVASIMYKMYEQGIAAGQQSLM